MLIDKNRAAVLKFAKKCKPKDTMLLVAISINGQNDIAMIFYNTKESIQVYNEMIEINPTYGDLDFLYSHLILFKESGNEERIAMTLKMLIGSFLSQQLAIGNKKPVVLVASVIQNFIGDRYHTYQFNSHNDVVLLDTNKLTQRVALGAYNKMIVNLDGLKSI